MPPRDDLPSRPPASPAPRSGLLLMLVIVVVFGAVSLFSNYQKRHIREIEQVTIGPAVSPVPAPSRPPADPEQ